MVIKRLNFSLIQIKIGTQVKDFIYFINEETSELFEPVQGRNFFEVYIFRSEMLK